MPVRRKLKPAVRKAPSPQQRWFESFVAYLRNECHLAGNTVLAYQRDLQRFAQWLGGRRVETLTVQELSDYAAWLATRKLARPASLDT